MIINRVVRVGLIIGGLTYLRYHHVKEQKTKIQIQAINNQNYSILLDIKSLNLMFGLEDTNILLYSSRFSFIDHDAVVQHAVNRSNIDALSVLILIDSNLVLKSVIQSGTIDLLDKCIDRLPGIFNQYQVASTVCKIGRHDMLKHVINAIDKKMYNEIFLDTACGELTPSDFKMLYNYAQQLNQQPGIITEKYVIHQAVLANNLHVAKVIKDNTTNSFEDSEYQMRMNILDYNSIKQFYEESK